MYLHAPRVEMFRSTNSILLSILFFVLFTYALFDSGNWKSPFLKVISFSNPIGKVGIVRFPGINQFPEF